MIEKPKNAVIYYRVSTDEQARNGVSLKDQRIRCIEFAKRNSISIKKIFHDDGESAKTADRAALTEMLDFCEKNCDDVDFLIIYKIDRFSRNTFDYSDILKKLGALNIQLLSSTEAVDNSPSGKFVGHIMSATAQYDNDVRAERITHAMKRIVLDGKWCYESPLGYLNVSDASGKKYIKVDETRAEHITWIFEEFAKGHHTLKEIREMVTARGLRSKKGKEISVQFMSKMIRRTFYFGLMYLPRYDEYYPGTHQPLISEETFRICQEQLKNHKAKGKATYRGTKESSFKFPLRGFICCKKCGRPITGSDSTGRNGKKYPTYQCYYGNCKGFRSGAKPKLESAFLKRLVEITPNPELIRSYRAIILDVWKSKHKELYKEQKRLEKAKNDISDQKSGLIKMKSMNQIDDGDFREQLDKIKQEEAKILIDYNKLSIEDLDMDQVVDDVFDIIGNLAEFWEESTYERKLKLQGSIFLEKPTYDGERVENTDLSILVLKKDSLQLPQSILVARRGIEPLLPG